jgi:heavy metal sensor kinase
VGIAAGDADDILKVLLIIMATVYPAALVAATIGGMFLAGRALSPVDRLTRLARSITAQNLSKRLSLPRTDDEIGRLAQTFDEMIARLDEAFRRQRQFTADASHELRTPLTAIKGQVEVGLSKTRDAASYREVLEAVEQETDRLIRLVGSLLTLARADAGQLQIANEPTSLTEILDSAREQVKLNARERRIELTANYGRAVHIRGDRSLLIQLFLNLLENAIKYTEPGGAVTAGWTVDAEEVRVWVRDTGVGIPFEHQSHIFERFYRADSARSRAQGGAGLGLSICRWISEAHGGSISAESTPGGGSVFTVRLPL